MSRDRTSDVATLVTAALTRHPAVGRVELVGSRARGEATDWSDWDFRIETADFTAVARELPALVRWLRPLAEQWDRLSRHRTYMLLLRGPVKVDLLFSEPNAPQPPWRVEASTLPAVDAHFWDWILWIAGKAAAGKDELVQDELTKLFAHLLAPMGVERAPADVFAALAAYKAARREWEDRLQVALRRDLEREVEPLLLPT